MYLSTTDASVNGLDQAFSLLAVTTHTPWHCNICNAYFTSQNALDHHKITHLPVNVHCLACPRKFRRYCDMLIHLEAGTCASGTNLASLNRLAAMCFQWKKYIASKEVRQRLLACRDGGVEPFMCPRCGEGFGLLSGLAMHCWAKPEWCGQGVNGGALGKLKRWLGKSLWPWRKGWRTDAVVV